MEVAATVHITFNATENQSGRVGRPTKGTFTLKAGAATTLALTTLIVATVGGGEKVGVKSNSDGYMGKEKNIFRLRE